MEKVWFKNDRGQRLAGVFHAPSSNLLANIIITHGFRGSKEGGGRAVILGEELARLGYGVLRFDFAGVGESEGDFAEITVSRQVEDLRTAVNWVFNSPVRREVPLLGLGRSLGGSTLLIAAAQDSRIAGVCFWSTPYDLPQTFSRILDKNFDLLKSGRSSLELQDEKGKFILRSDFVQDLYRHNLEQHISSINLRPILIIHGEQDEVVAVEQARKAYTMAGNPKEIAVIPGGDHRFLQTWPNVWDRVFIWLDKYFKA